MTGPPADDPDPTPRQRLAGPVAEVAPLLLGATLTSTVDDHPVALRVTEVEAYAGTGEDEASHAHRGPTPRSAVMFGEAGHAYVYFTYGMHWCVNVVTGPVGVGAAVLPRAGEVVAGLATARARRPAARHDRDLARGPARLAAALGVDGGLNGVDVLDATSPLRLELAGQPPAAAVQVGPRVGVRGAADRPWRFWLADEPTVSRYRAPGPRRRASRQPRGSR